LLTEVAAQQETLRAGREAAAAPAASRSMAARSAVSTTVPVPAPPDLELHVLRDVPLSHIYPYVNLQMLLGKHLGLKGAVGRLLEGGDPKALELRGMVADLQREAAARAWLRADGLYRFYEASGEGDGLVLHEGGREGARFRLPRQPAGGLP